MGTPEPVLRFAGATVAFRLEAVVGDGLNVRPESLVGLTVELQAPFGILSGCVRSCEPYVDAQLGPGHWVVLAPGSGAGGRTT